jgi:hypothetical protein
MFYNIPSSSHSFLGCNCFVAARNWSKTHPAPLNWRSAAQLEQSENCRMSERSTLTFVVGASFVRARPDFQN